MPSSPLSWARVASRGIETSAPMRPSMYASTNVALSSRETANASTQPALVSEQTRTSALNRSRVAFISGHIDITPAQFSRQYSSFLDDAIRRGDSFVLSNAGGVDTLALAYLRSNGVSPSRVTIYMHTPRPNRKLNATQVRVNNMRLGAEVEEMYRREGYNMKIVHGYHTERDAAMTEESDYDILWVRGEEETRLLYGDKYRPGRVSGTQKNKDRREAKERRAARITIK